MCKIKKILTISFGIILKKQYICIQFSTSS